MKLFWIFLFSSFPSGQLLAAACCGGGFAIPSVISGDERAQFTTSFSRSEVQADVFTSGLWKKREIKERSHTLRLNASHIIKDRWQVGLGIPIVRRSLADQSSTGLGNISALLGYEYLPIWEYDAYRPKGIGFLQLILPTGKSIYEADTTYALDSRGRGFWAIGFGTVLTKTFFKWDSFLSLEIHRSFSKSVSNSTFNGTLKPGWGGTIEIGAGFNKSNWRIGTSISWTYEDPVALEASTTSRGNLQRYATFSIPISYQINDLWTSSLVYSDQTIIDSPHNTSLSRSFMIQLQRRWLR